MDYNTEEIFRTYSKLGTYAATSKELGIDPRTVRRHVANWHETNSFVSHETQRTGVPFSRVSHYWLKTKNEVGDDVSMFVKNEQDALEYEELRDLLVADLKAYAPIVPRFKYQQNNENHLLVLDPADIHIGKLALTDETDGPEYNIALAYERVLKGTLQILANAQAFGIENIVLVAGNDILHIDTPRRTTTGGTPQDTDGQWWSMFVAARNLYVDIIEMAKEIAPVTVVYCPSNHDYQLGFTLIDSLYSWYRNDNNVTISDYSKSMRHRKYLRYGANLIGFTHGDGAKNNDLTTLMQYEARTDWANTRYSYWYVHHMHHKYRQLNGVTIEKDHAGVTVIGNSALVEENNTSIECIRTPSPSDGWHSRNGYTNAQAIEAFIHHPIEGQVARLTAYC